MLLCSDGVVHNEPVLIAWNAFCSDDDDDDDDDDGGGDDDEDDEDDDVACEMCKCSELL